MSPVLLPSVTALVAFVMAVALFDQWRERRRSYQLAWAIGSLLFAVASAAEAIAAAAGWNVILFKTWYLAGAVMNVGWLGLGTALLLAKTRFGYAYAALVAASGLFMVLSQSKNHYPDVGPLVFGYLIAALILAIAIGVETYFQNERWPRIAAIGVIAASVLALVLGIAAKLPEGPLALDAHGVPVLDPLPGMLRLLTPFMNVTGGMSLVLGALFSAYVFMPKKRVLGYSLDPGQKGDVMLFNLLIAPVAIVVNFLASLPSAAKGLVLGRLHSRVPATLLIAIGALLISGTDFGVKGGSTEIFQLSKLIGIGLIFLGFLVSIEAFREIRIPFTSIRLARARREPVETT
jgi:N-terminal 7TM region of histidine kinase